jgi:diguanylate cyclase (GGDEF)-like protein
MYLRETDAEKLRCVVSYNTPKDYTGIVLNFGEGAAGRVAQTGQPLIVGDYSTWEGRSPQYEKDHPFRSLVSVPMFWQGQLTGVLHVMYHLENYEFNWHDVELLSRFASQAAIAIDNARIFERSQGQAREAETLREAGAIVASSLDQDLAIDHILEQLERVVPYDSAAVQLLRDGHVEIVGGRGWADNSQVLGLRFPVSGSNPNSVVIRSRRPFILADAPKEHQAFREEPHSHIRSWLGVPLIIHAQVIGMISIDKTIPNFFTPKHVELATAFADQVAISIENARLFSDVQERIGELDALRETVADITSELELPKLLKSILRRATRLLRASGGELALYEPESEMILVALTHNMPRDYSGVRMIKGEGVMGKVALTKAPLIVEDYACWEGRSPQFTDINWHGVLAAPMMIGKRLSGVIVVLDADPARRFTDSDQKLLMMLAQQASIAVENARLYEEAQQLAITDPLTGLYNRRGLFELGQREVSRLHRYKRPLSAIMLDIDHFKLVNDRYSHAVGDEVLRVLADRCTAHLRETDVLSRYGGEEFAILLPETGLEEARQIAERLRCNISDIPVETKKGPISITISLGVICTQDGTADLALLLDRADTAMYEAKKMGRDRVALDQ